MDVVLFTDLNCPFCYATERRIEALGAGDRVRWCGVEHEPDLPVPMELDDDELVEELGEEVASVRSRAPEVPIAVPPGKPNTALGLAVAAAAMREDPERGAAVRHDLYAAFWQEGADLSDPDVLARISGDLDVLPADERAVAEWRLEWERAPKRGVPLLVRSDGETLYGLK